MLHVFKTIRLSAASALEMHMLMMMFGRCTILFTKGVLQTSLSVEDFMHHAFVQKGFECTIYCHAVVGLCYFPFNV